MNLSVDAESVYIVLIAAALGGLIGLEREFNDKPAGFRTNMLIAIGAAMFTLLSRKLAGDNFADQTRIAAQIVTGVGFLGAGVILRDRLTVYGITTAATIWAVASIGMCVGGGYVGLSLVTTAVILVVLFIFDHVEKVIDSVRGARRYVLSVEASEEVLEQLQTILREAGLKVRSTRSRREQGQTTLELLVVGSREAHAQASRRLITSEHIQSVSVS